MGSSPSGSCGIKPGRKSTVDPPEVPVVAGPSFRPPGRLQGKPFSSRCFGTRRAFTIRTPLKQVVRTGSSGLREDALFRRPAEERLQGKPCDRPEASGRANGLFPFHPWSSCRVNSKSGIARGRAFPPSGGEASGKALLASLVVFFGFNPGQAAERTGISGLREARFPGGGGLKESPAIASRSWSFSLPSLAQASLARSGNEKARPLRGWAFLGGEGGIAQGRAFPGGGGFKESPSRFARGLFRSLPSPKQAWLGQGTKKPGHFVAGPSLAEREGFEPPVPLRAHLFSRQTRSTTLAPLRFGAPNIAEALLG